MPATAAKDNETLDHLLSVVDDGNQYSASAFDSKGRSASADQGVLSADLNQLDRTRNLNEQVGTKSPSLPYLSATDQWRRDVPRYHFRLTDGQEMLNHPEGMDLPGDAAAREEAVVLARSLKDGRIMPGRNWNGWLISIVDEEGRQVDTVPIAVVPEESSPTT